MNHIKLEHIILNSLKNLEKNKLCYFIKSPTPHRLIKDKNNNYNFVYFDKSLCDFIGIYNEKFVLIEAKETSLDRFYIKRLKNHQLEQLIRINELGGMSYIIFYFWKHNKILSVKINDYLNLILDKKSIKISQVEPFSKKLKLNGDVIENLESIFN